MASEDPALAIANSTSDFLIVLDQDGSLRYANPAFSRTLLDGLPASGQHLETLMDATSAERARAAIQQVLDTQETHQIEVFHFERDGRPRPILYTFSKLGDGVAAVGRDKTADLELLGEIVRLNMQLEEQQAQLADANAKLEQLAITDHITGIYNRLHFFNVAQHIFAEARRYNLPLCCFMMDVDNFKTVNDSHGHLFGDHVLKSIADRLRRNTRRSDVLARYGGEEFVLAAPNTDLTTATMLAERLRASIEQEPFRAGGTSAHVTISVGVAGTEVITAGPFDDLLQASDDALYAAKQAGRNRIHVHSGTPQQDGKPQNVLAAAYPDRTAGESKALALDVAGESRGELRLDVAGESRGELRLDVAGESPARSLGKV